MTHAESKKRREAIVAAIKAGEPDSSIAKRYGVSRSFVSNLARDNRPSLPTMRRTEVVRLGKLKLPAVEIAKKCSLGYPRTLAILREEGVPGYEKPAVVERPVAVRSFAILRQLLDGKSQADIAKEFGVSGQRIQQLKEQAQSCGFQLWH